MGDKVFILFVFLVLATLSCKEPFEPNLPVVPQGYLVVEGFINAKGPTQIKLSRTTAVDEKQAFKPERNALLTIEGDNGLSASLSGASNGVYSSAALVLNGSNKYRLRIRTSDTKEYLSDFAPVKISPPIDSITWAQGTTGVQVYANTHDPQNKTIYYRWDYDETWAIQSAYFAGFKLDRVEPGTGVRVIRETTAADPAIYRCWRYDTSKNIVLSSSAKLEQDVIYKQPIVLMPRMDERLGIRYSIQVRQYALDKEGYQFYEQMKKNTESLGSIFDPQPSALKGNIRCISHPGEIVIGYIPVTTVEQVRIFISEIQLTGGGFSISRICESKDIANNQDSLKGVVPPDWPYEAIYSNGGGGIIAYKVASATCVDCTARGGKNVQPSFW